ncbi:hypothetical protein, partial [Brucella intermedia]|uniref:hypothetical protein n=1 Tax=Brucella intermedia TaxID=94625 RepID=UPI001AEEC95F
APEAATRAAAEPRRRLLMFISDLQSRIGGLGNKLYISNGCQISETKVQKDRKLAASRTRG